MLRRISLFAVVGLLAMVVLAACGEDDEGEEPTVTRIPATNVPSTTAPTTAAGSPAAGSPAASPSTGGAATPEASPETPATEAAASSPEAPVASPEATAGASPVSSGVTINLVDIAFDPKEITIPANADVTINLVNQGAGPHTFDIDALNIHSGSLQPGQSATVTVNAAAGDYEYYCAEPGHKQAGMVGTLHAVAEDAAAQASAASPEASPVAPPAASPEAAQVPSVDLVDIAFSPKELTIPANTDVVVHLVNKGVTVHTFDIDQLNIHSGEIAPNQTLDVTINAAPGEYEFYCAIPGHKQAGMAGKLIVQ
jgi:uncharacterized cupredoxin-like copper-binding protein